MYRKRILTFPFTHLIILRHQTAASILIKLVCSSAQHRTSPVPRPRGERRPAAPGFSKLHSALGCVKFNNVHAVKSTTRASGADELTRQAATCMINVSCSIIHESRAPGCGTFPLRLPRPNAGAAASPPPGAGSSAELVRKSGGRIPLLSLYSASRMSASTLRISDRQPTGLLGHFFFQVSVLHV